MFIKLYEFLTTWSKTKDTREINETMHELTFFFFISTTHSAISLSSENRGNNSSIVVDRYL